MNNIYVTLANWLKETEYMDCSIEKRSTIYDRLVFLYSDNKRKYHNISHINHMLSLANKYKDRINNWEAFYLAIWYHDVIYVPGNNNNETHSAALSIEHLLYLDLDHDIIHAVDRLIIGTRAHANNKMIDDSDVKLFLDFDLAILGSKKEIYQNYANSIREEYRDISQNVYEVGRCKFLRSMLDFDKIYHSDIGLDLWENNARYNMLAELAQYNTDEHTPDPIQLSSNKKCYIHHIRKMLLPHYYVLSYPKEQGEPTHSEVLDLIDIGIDKAKQLAHTYIGNSEAFTVFYSGYSARRDKGWHMHIFLLDSRWRKVWLYMMLSLKNVLQLLNLRKDDLPKLSVRK